MNIARYVTQDRQTNVDDNISTATSLKAWGQQEDCEKRYKNVSASHRHDVQLLKQLTTEAPVLLFSKLN